MNAQPIRIMLDLETMSLEDNAAIVQIGACSMNGHNKFCVYIKPESSERAGLHVDKQTMEWWDKQDATVRARVFGGTYELEEALSMFSLWVKDQCAGDLTRLRMYANGPEFDWVILKNSFLRVFGSWPFSHRAPQSLRTLRDIADMLGMQVPKGSDNSHDALYDALNQAAEARWIMGRIAL